MDKNLQKVSSYHITVKSENGPNNCIIDCENSGKGFNFNNTGQNLSDVIDGFTIRKGNVGGNYGWRNLLVVFSLIIDYNLQSRYFVFGQCVRI